LPKRRRAKNKAIRSGLEGKQTEQIHIKKAKLMILNLASSNS